MHPQGDSMGLQDHRNDWNELAELDPVYAISGKRKGEDWDEEAFFESGRAEIAEVVAYLQQAAPGLRYGSALDFGCGIGRLSRAMLDHWDEVTGLDISSQMISMATKRHGDVPGLRFVVNERSDLSLLPDGELDFIYSNVTLMHVPDERAIESYVREFLRVLAPGGFALFQLPTRIPLARRIKLKRHAYHLLRALGVPPATLYRKLGLHPTKIRAVPRSRVEGWLSDRGEIVDLTGADGEWTRYLVRRSGHSLP